MLLWTSRSYYKNPAAITNTPLLLGTHCCYYEHPTDLSKHPRLLQKHPAAFDGTPLLLQTPCCYYRHPTAITYIHCYICPFKKEKLFAALHCYYKIPYFYYENTLLLLQTPLCISLFQLFPKLNSLGFGFWELTTSAVFTVLLHCFFTEKKASASSLPP